MSRGRIVALAAVALVLFWASSKISRHRGRSTFSRAMSKAIWRGSAPSKGKGWPASRCSPAPR